MPGRYTLFQLDTLPERFQLGNGLPASFKKRYNITPTQLSPVIVERDGVRKIEMMKWGFIPRLAKDANSVFRYKTFNARSESIFDKVTWRDAIRTRRCLVPANGFYEWQITSTGKKPFFIRPKDQDLFSFAGIYSSWQDTDGKEWGTYSIVTTTPNREMKSIHDRMPVILSAKDEATWLDPTVYDAGVLYDFMRPYPDDMLLMSEVSPTINSMKVDNPTLITRLRTD